MSRIVVWFSCGAPSACAAKLALDKFGPDVAVVYCDMSKDEHPDNKRFAEDVERWLGKTIIRVRSTKYGSVDDVIAQTRYFAGVRGARCTTELKKLPRREWELPDDLHIWGYTVEEFERIVRFKQQNPESRSYFILAGQGMTKDDCKRMVAAAGIKLPVMYELGFENNNCIGCGKAESVEYWQRVRHYFPEIFQKRCEQSREIGWRPLRLKRGNHPAAKRERLHLDELPPVDEQEGLLPIFEEISCGPHCGI